MTEIPTAPTAEVVARAPLPTVASADDLEARLDQTHPAMVLPAQLQLAQDRAVWLGERLREQVERDGVGAVVGAAYTVTLDGQRVKVGEYARVLFEAERREREHVASLAERVARLGLDRGAYNRDVAAWAVAAMKALACELGRELDERTDPEAHAAMRRAAETLRDRLHSNR